MSVRRYVRKFSNIPIYKHTNIPKREEGIALITTLLMLGLMLVLALSAILSSTTDIQVSRNVKENTRDIFVADGGLEWFKSQESYYANNNFTINNPFTNTLNTLSIASGSSSKIIIDGLRWLTANTSAGLAGSSGSADTKWASPAVSACTSSTGRDSSTFPLYYTSVTVGSSSACLKAFAPVWEGIYATRTDSSSKKYYPRDHIGNYRLNFDSSPVANANPSKPNFFSIRFPDMTATETVSIPQKSVMSDVRFNFGNNLYFFQSKPYADPQTCNTSTADNPDGTCAAYNPNGATVDPAFKPPTSGTNAALNTEPFEGVSTNIDDSKALIIYKTVGATKYIHGIAQRYDSDPNSSGIGTVDDTPYAFVLGNNGSANIGVEIDGQTASTNCIDRSGTATTCSELVALTDSADSTIVVAGLFEVVKIGVKQGSCQADIYVPKNLAAGAGTYYKPWSSTNGLTTEARSTTTATYTVGSTYMMKLVDVATYIDNFLDKLETINTSIDPQCTWANITSTKAYEIGTSQGTQVEATQYDFSIYSNTVTSATGTTINIGGVNVTASQFIYPE